MGGLTPVRRALVAGGAILVAVAGTTAAAAQSSGSTPGTGSSSGGPRTIVANYFTKIAPLDESGPFGRTAILEGPTFGPDGQLYIAHPSAPAGGSKVVTLNTQTRKVKTLYTDSTNSAFGSLQFSPVDGKMYLTDINGHVDRMNANGTGFTTILSSPVLGSALAPDDLTFDRSGAMFITDLQGTPWKPIGRVIRLDPNGTHPKLLMGGLAGGNGISFDPTYSALWVSEYRAGREDYLPLSADHTSVADPSIGMYGNEGVGGFDSNAVDTAGNIYQCVIGTGTINVWNPKGQLLAKIVVPQTMTSPELLVTNLAIKPGTREGYLVVGGENGGFVYTFPALGIGGMQSNGGGVGK